MGIHFVFFRILTPLGRVVDQTSVLVENGTTIFI